MQPDEDYFDGVETGTDALPDGGSTDDPALTGDDTYDTQEWRNDLTYREIHSATIGGSLSFLAAAVGLPLWGAFAGLCLVAIGSEMAQATRTCNRTGKVCRWVAREPHYFLGAGVAGVILAGLTTTFLLSTAIMMGWV